MARRVLEETLAAAGLTHGALIGAGVSLPGPVRHHPDVVKPSAILPGWHGVTGRDIEEALGVPVSIDNDANLAALGEHVWGAGQGCDDCVTIKFHYGIRTAMQRNIAPNEAPDLVVGALGTRHTALGAVALALGESDWLPV
jgi:predicted NBD/HSP70 family sugar kinase